MSENGPTTDEVRLAYATSRDDRDMSKYRYDLNAAGAEWDRIRDESYAEFDRWLAQSRREAMQRAVDDFEDIYFGRSVQTRSWVAAKVRERLGLPPRGVTMSEYTPTTGKDARAEAERLYRKDATEIEASLSIHDAATDGFVVGAAWQRSLPFEVTEEMVERAAKALYAASPIPLYDENAGRITGAKPWEWLSPEYRAARRDDARSALRAVREEGSA